MRSCDMPVRLISNVSYGRLALQTSVSVDASVNLADDAPFSLDLQKMKVVYIIHAQQVVLNDRCARYGSIDVDETNLCLIRLACFLCRRSLYEFLVEGLRRTDVQFVIEVSCTLNQEEELK